MLARLLNRFRTGTQVTRLPVGPVGRLCHFQVSPPNEIELEASGNELKRVFERTTQAWQALGKEEPYWSVLTSDSFVQRCWMMPRAYNLTLPGNMMSQS